MINKLKAFWEANSGFIRKCIAVGWVAGALVAVSIATYSSSFRAVNSLADDTKALKEIYAKLVKTSGQPGLPLRVVDSNILNAWTTKTEIVFTTTMIKAFNSSKDQMALVVAHEMSHEMLKHNYFSKQLINIVEENIGTNIEAHADKLGTYLMLRAGYDVCAGREIFVTFEKSDSKSALTIPGDPHPSNKDRYISLSMPWCKGSSF